MTLYEDFISGKFNETIENDLDIRMLYNGKLFTPYNYKFEIEYKDEYISKFSIKFSIKQIEYLDYFKDILAKLNFDMKEATLAIKDKYKDLYFEFMLKDEVIRSIKQKVQPLQDVEKMFTITDSKKDPILFDLTNYKINFIRVEQLTFTS